MGKQPSAFPLRIEPSNIQKIKAIAAKHGRSTNKEIEQILAAHIGEYERLHGPIKIEDCDDMDEE